MADEIEEVESQEPEQHRRRTLGEVVTLAEAAENRISLPRPLADLIKEAGDDGRLERDDCYEVTEDEALEALVLMLTVKSRLRQLAADLEEGLIYWILVNGRDLVIGDKRWYVGVEHKSKCLDVSGTLETLLDVTAGDMAQVAGALIANPFKPAHTKGLIADPKRAAKLFESWTVPDLKTGKPRKRLQQADRRFSRKP